MSHADELYQGFHRDEATHEMRVPCRWPSRARSLGPAGHIVYRTDKWGEGEQDYIHQFGPGTAIWAACDDGSRAVAKPRGPVAWLGGLVELVLIGEDGRQVHLSEGSPEAEPRDLAPVLAYRPPNSTRARLIVVPGDQATGPAPRGGALIVMGPRMNVEPRGVVG